MTKVYVVRYGEYSDQGILGVFSTEEKAQKYCDIHNEMEEYGDYWIDEYELDKYEINPTAKVVTYYKVGIALVDDLDVKKGEFYDWDYEDKEIFVNPVEIIIHDKDKYSYPYIEVWSTTSFEHAKKVAIEQYQIYTQQKLEEEIMENK